VLAGDPLVALDTITEVLVIDEEVAATVAGEVVAVLSVSVDEQPISEATTMPTAGR
jgi:hypothetical protein